MMEGHLGRFLKVSRTGDINVSRRSENKRYKTWDAAVSILPHKVRITFPTVIYTNAITFAGGDTMRTRSEFENELNENKVQFARIRDKNVNFILCQFQRFVLYLQKEYFGFLFWNSHRTKFMFFVSRNYTLFLSNALLISDLVLVNRGVVQFWKLVAHPGQWLTNLGSPDQI